MNEANPNVSPHLRFIAWFRARRYLARYISLILTCVILNLSGIAVTQAVGISIFFFDMIGTAVAALLSGMTAGVVVAIISSTVGTIIVGKDSYCIFGVVNIMGAIGWSVLPRIGWPWLGSDIFNPDPSTGYQRLAFRIFVVGSLVGLGCTLASLLLLIGIFGIDSPAGQQFIAVASSGSATGQNNSLLAAVIHNLISGSAVPHGSILTNAISLFVSNVPDKIIATATAVALIFSFATLPNFRSQKDAGSKYIKHYGKMRFLYLLSMACFLYPFGRAISELLIPFDNVIMSVTMVAICGVLIVIAPPRYFKSIDRTDTTIVVHFRERERYEFIRDVFEDYLKGFLVIFTLLNFVAATVPYDESVVVQYGHYPVTVSHAYFYVLGLKNLLLLTAFRYLFVIMMRLSGRFR
jgi:hypothetical protein